ncbi:MAG: preprotein translocase subunit SecG [Candidatus Taylorbacteria bacterium CG11_big_fil_rev_8_21_14_0_20_46_11]|uniref:Protein-export membrane protein SecG n=1 Tax=Candidatus Taylorbacteria bacterium CG11_big_fil_rev_8_21_14_0_20_46_11 TaxID=1975025 RepID=A0A2H0K9T9_9BACT|nr:MAG: preprotein translocase subunit SecG [Candidatus Taylorbacteria bacterium CG11_big_fil_rev_8_21_14_0_20_46_11]
MQTLSGILPYVQVGLSVLLIVVVLLQQSAAGLGGAFGDNFASGFHTRRGFEKTLFNISVVIAILFVASALVALVIR